MKRFYLIVFVCLLCFVASAQRVKRSFIPYGAIFYNSQWQGVASADKATYYRILGVDNKGQKIFYDYFITGQLKAEKHYISINKQNDHNTILNGVCRTFHKSGRVESVLQYKNGKANGRALSFFPNGNIGMKLSYRNGLLDGPCYTYAENGRLEYTTIWRNGSKVNEIKGGKDHNIDKKTNEDEFCERYRHDEAVIMAQSKNITKVRENGNSVEKIKQRKTTLTKDTLTSQPVHEELVHNRPTKKDDSWVKNNEFSHATAENRYVGNIKYPETSDKEVGSGKERISLDMKLKKKGEFNFAYLYSLLSREDERLKNLGVLINISHNFQLTSSQIIDGFGAQKEVIFNHNMIYESQSGKDEITGQKPRQIGYFGTVIGNKLQIDRIKIFTWSEEEMYHFAQDAVQAGFKTLGGVDYQSADGNFILEQKTKPINYDEHEVIVTFTHQPNLYSGLYHIQMDIR